MPQTLLLADDSVTIQRVIELTFADQNIQVIAVSDGDQAIARLDADPPDIVLADVGMPGRNGYQVAQYIKQTPGLAHIPVMLLTGAFEPVDQAKAAAAGCDGVLAKPFEPQLVIGRVKELLARSRHATISFDPDLAPPLAATSEPWASPIIDQSLGGALAFVGQPAESAPIDYFDRLDATFANLATPSHGTPKYASPSPAPDVDWFGTMLLPTAPAVDHRFDIAPLTSPAEPVDLPLAHPRPEIDFDRSVTSRAPVPAQEGASAEPPVQPPTEGHPPVQVQSPTAQPVQTADVPAQGASSAATLHPIRPVLPPMADTFTALLAAELNQATPSEGPLWPTLVPPVPIDTDDLIEQVTSRVLSRLSDSVVRETVSEIVSKVAERLVLEEIDRIKNAMK